MSELLSEELAAKLQKIMNTNYKYLSRENVVSGNGWTKAEVSNDGVNWLQSEIIGYNNRAETFIALDAEEYKLARIEE